MNKSIDHTLTLAQTRSIMDRSLVSTQNVNTEVLIIGGNLTGITLASILQERGHDVTLMIDTESLFDSFEQQYLLFTKASTPLYAELLQNAGIEKTKLYYEAIQEAIYFFKYQIERLKLDCLLSVEDVYFFAETSDEKRLMENEIMAMELAGIPIERVIDKQSERFLIENVTGYVLRDQLQFCPSRYVASLLNHFCSHGGKIIKEKTINNQQFATSVAIRFEDDQTINAEKVVFTTPPSKIDWTELSLSRTEEQGSIKTGVLKNKSLKGIHVRLNPTQSSLSIHQDDNSLKIGVLFEKYSSSNFFNSFEKQVSSRMEKICFENFQCFENRTERYITSDSLPSIGQLDRISPNVFLATGYREDDISSSLLSSLLLTSLIRDLPSKYRTLFNPYRFAKTK